MLCMKIFRVRRRGGDGRLRGRKRGGKSEWRKGGKEGWREWEERVRGKDERME